MNFQKTLVHAALALCAAPAMLAQSGITLAPDGSAYVLWVKADGSLKAAFIDPALNEISSRAYTSSAVFGWTPRDIATGLAPGTIDWPRGMWTSSNGRVRLGRLGGASAETASFDGWTPLLFTVGADGHIRVLWQHTTGLVSIWLVAGFPYCDAALGRCFSEFEKITYREHGPFSGWTPKAMKMASDGKLRILWAHSLGIISFWIVRPDLTQETYKEYGPYFGWTPKTFGAGGDGKTRILWASTYGTASVWLLDQALNLESYREHSRGYGWTPGSIAVRPDGKTLLAWYSADSRLLIWLLNSTLDFEKSREYALVDGSRPGFPR
jgi:hypothetical protein